MSHLTAGADLAWRMAAAEAASSGHVWIERSHLLVGILSLEKVTTEKADALKIDPSELASVRAERTTLAELLAGLDLDAADLRRAARRALGEGPGAPKGPLSRSEDCKAVFTRAAALGRERPVSALLLLAALAESPDPVLEALLAERSVEVSALLKRARAFGGVSAAEVLVLPPGGARAAARVPDPEPLLKERLVGQDHVIARVASRLRLARDGLGERRGPLAVFLCLGPSGVGKTELARLLAESLFGAEEALARFDLSEIRDEHAVARLLGAPPGAPGPVEEGQLSRHLRARPHSVVLLDEAEKAHPRVYDILLQVFEGGRIADAQGHMADARHAVFVLSSGLGGEAPHGPVGSPAGVDPASVSDPNATAREEARRLFRPELLSRIDEVLVFRALDEEDTRRIARPMIEALCREMRERHGVSFHVEPEAEAFVARAGFDPASGARGLRSAIERLLEAPLKSLALSGKLARHPAWRAAYEEGGVYLIPDEG
jgi:hypothetical protein